MSLLLIILLLNHCEQVGSETCILKSCIIRKKTLLFIVHVIAMAYSKTLRCLCPRKFNCLKWKIMMTWSTKLGIQHCFIYYLSFIQILQVDILAFRGPDCYSWGTGLDYRCCWGNFSMKERFSWWHELDIFLEYGLKFRPCKPIFKYHHSRHWDNVAVPYWPSRLRSLLHFSHGRK